MPVISLGAVGKAEGSGTSLAIPITTAVPASSVTTLRALVMFYLAISQHGQPTHLLPPATDNAALTNPNKCYGPNVYHVNGLSTTTIGALQTPSGVQEVDEKAWVFARVFQPLPIGKTITLAFTKSCYYIGAIVVALEASTEDPVDSNVNDRWERLGNGFAPCFSQNDTVNAGFCTFGVFALWQYWAQGTSSLTFQQAGVVTEASMYDFGAEAHASMVFGTRTLTPGGTYDVGGCTDVTVPTAPAVITLNGGWMRQMGDDNSGLAPCPPVNRCHNPEHEPCSHSGGVHCAGGKCP